MLITLVLHTIALGTMVSLIGPGMDLLGAASTRLEHVRAHPWLWRLGWLPWQLCGPSDLFVSVVLLMYVRASPGRRGQLWAAAACVFNVVAIVPDEWGEALLVTELIEQARAGDLNRYVAIEIRTIELTGTCAASAYIVMTVCWIGAVLRQRRSTALAIIGGATCVLFSVVAWFNHQAVVGASVAGYPGFARVFAGNAVAFPLLNLTFIAMALVIAQAHHARFDVEADALHRLRAPRSGGGVSGWVQGRLQG